MPAPSFDACSRGPGSHQSPAVHEGRCCFGELCVEDLTGTLVISGFCSQGIRHQAAVLQVPEGHGSGLCSATEARGVQEAGRP